MLVSCSVTYSFGNLNTYVISYLRDRVDKDIDYADWIYVTEVTRLPMNFFLKKLLILLSDKHHDWRCPGSRWRAADQEDRAQALSGPGMPHTEVHQFPFQERRIVLNTNLQLRLHEHLLVFGLWPLALRGLHRPLPRHRIRPHILALCRGNANGE